ncbi:MAG: hypothetical protein PHE88_12330 [Elusimicrobia bacterium]|nr:hypothetical protein [Elusimicrobiota bacterium]
MQKTEVRSEISDPELLFQQLTICKLQVTDYRNAVIALAAIAAEHERRLNKLFERVNNIGLVIDRNGKTTFEKFQELETKIIDMGFPT